MTVESPSDLIRVVNADASGDFIILCDHASNSVPQGFGALGLSATDMERHIAWDPGALPVAQRLAQRLNAPLVYPDASRLLIDCNRPPGGPDSIPTISETTEIPGNRDLSPDLRARRIALIYDAYHSAVAALIASRKGPVTALIAVHSFTPVYRAIARPWHIGIVVDADRRLAEPLLRMLRCEADLVVGENRPYSPRDGVYHSLERHAASAGLPAVMIEIRNDLLTEANAQSAWADRLAAALERALQAAIPTTLPDAIESS